MKNFILVFSLLSFSIHSFSQLKNIKVADDAFNPSITIDKKNSEHVIVGVAPNQIISTNDAGKTWESSQPKSSLGFGGEPLVVSTIKGHLLYIHLGNSTSAENTDHIVAQVFDGDYNTWDDGVSIGNTSTNPAGLQASIHNKKNEVLLTWTQFDKYKSSDTTLHSNIMFSKSANGNKWSQPIQLNQLSGNCLDDDNTVMGATSAISLDGKIYAVWASGNHFYMNRAYDGSNWLSSNVIIGKQEGGWAFTIEGLQRANGLPSFFIDNSPFNTKGTLHLAWGEEKTEGDADVWYMRSRNRGDIWSKPMRINQDGKGHQQFFPRMAFDQIKGSIYMVYYDRRNYDDLQTDVYLAYSFNGGNSFAEIKISESPFIADASIFLGDRIGIDAHDGIITPIWTRIDNGKTSVWTVIIKEEELKKMK